MEIFQKVKHVSLNSWLSALIWLMSYALLQKRMREKRRPRKARRRRASNNENDVNDNASVDWLTAGVAFWHGTFALASNIRMATCTL